MKQPILSLSIGTEADVGSIISLSRDLFNESVYSSVSVFDDEFVRSNYLSSLKLPINEFVTILLRVGGSECIGFLSCGHSRNQFSKDKYATELGFWIYPEYKTVAGMKMLVSAYYYWAKETGCKAAMMGKLHKDKVESYRMKVLI